MNRLRDELRRQARAPSKVNTGNAAEELLRSRVEDTLGVEIAAQYEQGLMRLRPEEREAVVGRLELGLSYDELALALEKPSADAARKAAQRALVRLAEEMEREQ